MLIVINTNLNISILVPHYVYTDGKNEKYISN